MVMVAVGQVAVGDDETPTDRLERVAAWASDELAGADLVVLPELWATGAFDLDRITAAAEPLDGRFVAAMAQLARTLGATLHAGSFPERHDGGVSNTSVVLGPDGDVIATYRKIHLFGFDRGEATSLIAGSAPVSVPLPIGPTGLTTCYDLRFPELYRALTGGGVEAFVIPAGWPQARIDHWCTLTSARAVENQALVVACNAVGTSGRLAMGGLSRIVAADGTVVAQASADHTEALTVDVDAAAVVRWRREFPALRDRRM